MNRKPDFTLLLQFVFQNDQAILRLQLGSFPDHRNSTQWICSNGALAKKSVLHWRVPGPECPPEPQDGEMIVFMQHLDRGFSPPGSKFFRDVLASFQLHPQDIGPNSVSNICNFQVFCEVYLQEKSTVELFRDFFHLNRRTEFSDGTNTELGGVSIQKRKEVDFAHAKHHSHPKD